MYPDALYQLALQRQADLRVEAEHGRLARLLRRAARRRAPEVVSGREPARVVRPRHG